MEFKTVNLKLNDNSKRTLCIKKISDMFKIMSLMNKAGKAAIGMKLHGYIECCGDAGFINSQESEELQKMALDAVKNEGNFIILCS